MRIVVLGASGRVGTTLIPELINKGYLVYYDFINPLTNKRFDLTEFESIKYILELFKPDIIINLAAYTDVDLCEKNPVSAYLVNIKIVENIVKCIKLNYNKLHLIQLSTDHVYDGTGPHKEENHILTNYYSYSKYVSELIASNVSSTILRTNFIGKSQCKIRRSLTDWLLDSLKSKEPFIVFEDVYFSPLSLQKLSELIQLVIEKRITGLYNMGSKIGMSKADLAFKFAEMLNLDTKMMQRGNSDSIEFLSYRPKDMRMDSLLFENIFNINLPTLEEELLSLKKFYE